MFDNIIQHIGSRTDFSYSFLKTDTYYLDINWSTGTSRLMSTLGINPTFYSETKAF